MQITSASNPLVKRIRKLRSSRRAREEGHTFVVEGTQAITEAYRNGWRVCNLIYSPSLVESPGARRTLEASDPATRVEMAASLYRRLSERDDPPELMGIVERPPDDPRRLPLSSNLLVVAFDRIRNAGNLGSVIRSADALGATGVIVIEPSVDIYDPKAVRATMGALFAVPTVSFKDPEAFGEWVKTMRNTLDNVQLVAAVPRDAPPLDSYDFTLPSVIVIGNEQTGVCDDVLDLCGDRVSIPMTGSADSLNGAVAASICLYEASRQRRRQLLHGTDSACST